MKILFFCTVNITRPLEAGVTKKVLAQRKVLMEAGHEVYLACKKDDGDMVVLSPADEEIERVNLGNVTKVKRDTAITGIVERFALSNGIKVVYARYGTFSYFAYRLYKRLHDHGIIVLLEIATYPMSQRWNSVKQSARSFRLKGVLVGTYINTVGSIGIPLFKRVVERIVNNNGFERIWGIPVIPISNGIDVSSIPDKERKITKNGEIRVMSVANIANWHGFDRFIKGLGEYYRQPQDIKIYLEVAGPGAEVELLKQLAEKEKVSEYVKFTGPLVGKELDKLFDRSDMGISVLAVHRVNMKRCDSLKAREFCARRLPFITQEAEGQYVGQPFAMCVPSDETSIKMEDVISFYNNIAENPAILADMRRFAEEKCDWHFAFKNVVDYIESF